MVTQVQTHPQLQYFITNDNFIFRVLLPNGKPKLNASFVIQCQYG